MTPVDATDEPREEAPTGATSMGEDGADAYSSSDAEVTDDVADVAGTSELTEEADEPVTSPVRGGGWTLPLLCAGLSLLACCVIIPQVDCNRRAAYERLELQLDLASVQKQVSVNDVFLKEIGDDPTLAQRLAQRQMKIVREGSRVLDLGTHATAVADMSPYQITHVPRPRPLPAYRPVGGVLTSVCCAPRSRLYLLGLGLFMVASGLVLGFSSTDTEVSNEGSTASTPETFPEATVL